MNRRHFIDPTLPQSSRFLLYSKLIKGISRKHFTDHPPTLIPPLSSPISHLPVPSLPPTDSSPEPTKENLTLTFPPLMMQAWRILEIVMIQLWSGVCHVRIWGFCCPATVSSSRPWLIGEVFVIFGGVMLKIWFGLQFLPISLRYGGCFNFFSTSTHFF